MEDWCSTARLDDKYEGFGVNGLDLYDDGRQVLAILRLNWHLLLQQQSLDIARSRTVPRSINFEGPRAL
jgi:hypothetical protein